MEFVLIEAEIDFDCQLLGVLMRIGTMRTSFLGHWINWNLLKAKIFTDFDGIFLSSQILVGFSTFHETSVMGTWKFSTRKKSNFSQKPLLSQLINFCFSIYFPLQEAFSTLTSQEREKRSEPNQQTSSSHTHKKHPQDKKHFSFLLLN